MTRSPVSNASNCAQPKRTPILLFNSAYYGTLAAMRVLGRGGVPVVTVDAAPLSPGGYSRYSVSHLRCPPFEQTEQFIDWLMGVGRSMPGAVIYATSDAVSYALASHRDQLSGLFRLLQPDLETMMGVLDKGRLLMHARAVGIDTPETWLPVSRDDAIQLAKQIDQSVLVKPRSQLAVRNCTKGAVARSGKNGFLKEYDRFVELGAHDPLFAQRHPEVMQPMLQAYYPEAVGKIYSLSGFRDYSGQNIAMLAAEKIMQRPRRLGIGLCFEEAPVDPVLAAKIMSLCERLGYYGAFECEFIRSGDRALLIDFNARFYNQMALDIARGLDLPTLVYAAATGDDGEVNRLIRAFQTREKCRSYGFCNGVQFALTIYAQRCFGSISRDEAVSWRNWRADPEKTIINAAYDSSDHFPYVVDALRQLLNVVRHPRAFLKDCLIKPPRKEVRL